MISNPKAQTHNPKYLYRTIWRWHFYTGVFCIPFVILLALTGAIYLFKPYYEYWQESEYRGLPISGEAIAPNQQIRIALNAIPNGKLLSYRLPQTADEAVAINVQAENVWQVFINPYTGELLGKQRKDQMLMNLVKTFHGELLLGNVGSIFVGAHLLGINLDECQRFYSLAQTQTGFSIGCTNKNTEYKNNKHYYRNYFCCCDTATGLGVKFDFFDFY